MAKNSLVLGGTPGSHNPPSAMAQRLAIQFHFDAEQQAKLTEILKPSDAWRAEIEGLVGEFLPDPAAVVIATIEACATRFLRNKVRRVSKKDQKAYLEQLAFHTQALLDMFLQFSPIDGTIADPFRFMEKAGKAKADDRRSVDYRSEMMSHLTTLNLFGRFRLQQNVVPLADEAEEEKAKRRTEYPRFVLIADLLAAYKRITGREVTAHATKDRLGARQVSSAVEFITVALPPIMKAARLKSVVDDQTARNEIADVKRLWDAGQHPEYAYAIPAWGSRASG
ncbi:hypothetical protein LGH82_17665 [Mesorhizobium sp. PAMC28654]|uniref:hypothetical protein n=1 Tax=Mesorhizobium sp. PAMC28654 TaxID=2880934 RepID=UPI001D0B9449|nr:hypothetical protein [Mesorhizobium sp. PAMC28654]UDL87046.1 hypothetical protein LGH82_17665 [Mesorhizobium sp. PAMC28654]